MRATFVTLAAYDWRMLPASIASYYAYADEIIVGLDVNRRSWSGTQFGLDDRDLAEALSPYTDKITVVTDDFFNAHQSPLQNDRAERERLAKSARNNWVVEVDADEVLSDADALLAAMESCPPGCQVYAQEWTQVYKVISDTALVVTPSLQLCALATRSRARKLARQTGEPPVVAPVEVVHWTMGRDEADLVQKLASWSHSHQVRPGFLDQWRSVTLENYRAAKDLHYFRASAWPGLRAVPVSQLRSPA